MRLGIVVAFATVLPLLAACSNDKPPATPATQAPAPTAPAATTAPKPTQPVAVNVPAGAAPLIGTWAPLLSSCGDTAAVTTITATSYASPTGSCEIKLTPSGDGFTTSCGSNKMTLTPVFAPSGEGVNVIVGAGKRQTILRCTR